MTGGWHEFIVAKGTTHIAYIYDDGSVYLPEGPDVVDQIDLTQAVIAGKCWRLIRERT